MAFRKKSENSEVEQLRAENVRLKKSLDDLWAINQLARLISSTMPVDQILEKVVSVSVKAIAAEQGTISLVDESEMHDPFKTIVRQANSTSIKSKYRLDEELSGWMMRNQRPLLINDFDADTTFTGVHSEVKQIHSLLSVPLICKGKLIGILNLFNKKDLGKFSEDEQRLLSIIGSQSAQVIESARLYEQEKKLLLVEQELDMARKIQQRLLPKENPRIDHYDVAGISHAAKDVGGDYFDFIQLDASRWGIALGDVSGKGVPAALLMSSIQATLRNQVMVNPSITDCISMSNNFLHRNTESNKFATLFYGVLDCKDKSFEFVNAGHNFPFYLDAKGEYHTLEVGGLVLGMLPDCSFECDKVQMKPGEIIIIYSDGVTEAENTLEEQFGEERLQELMRTHSNLPAAEIVEKICAQVTAFETSQDQQDDITLVVIKAL